MAKTIKESAELLGISTQAIYKRIKNMDDNQLATFLTTDENGVRMLTEDGLEFIGGDRKDASPSSTEEPQSPDSHQPADQSMVNWLQAEISKLNDELKVERENSRELTRKLIKITENQQALLGHNMGMKQVDNHVVQAVSTAADEQTPTTFKQEETLVEEQSTPEKEVAAVAETKEELPGKEDESKGFFARLFNK